MDRRDQPIKQMLACMHACMWGREWRGDSEENKEEEEIGIERCMGIIIGEEQGAVTTPHPQSSHTPQPPFCCAAPKHLPLL